MTLATTEIIGYCAAFCTTIAFAPQAWLVWRTRSAESISLGMYAIFISGVVMWLIYGIRLSATPIIAANIVTLGLAGFILGMKIWLDSQSKAKQQAQPHP